VPYKNRNEPAGSNVKGNFRELMSQIPCAIAAYRFLRDTYQRYFLSDEEFVKINFRKKIGCTLNLQDPRTFNEKIQWMKLYYKDPLLSVCTDKYMVRDYVKGKGLDWILNDMHGLYERTGDIDLSLLPEQFVMKATHGSGWNIICKNKASLDWKAEFKRMDGWLMKNYFWQHREWAYKNIRPRIMCEKYLESDGQLIDYKIFCFNGEPRLLLLCIDRFSEGGLKVDFYDLEFNRLPFIRFYPNSDKKISAPPNFDKMIEISRALAEDFPFVRVDSYNIAGKITFGELTFYPGDGTEPFHALEHDEIVGSYLRLPDR
jgi:hypothetical protein